MKQKMGHGWGFLLLCSDCYRVKCIGRDRPEEGGLEGEENKTNENVYFDSARFEENAPVWLKLKEDFPNGLNIPKRPLSNVQTGPGPHFLRGFYFNVPATKRIPIESKTHQQLSCFCFYII